MDLLPNAEQQEIVSATAGLLEKELPVSRMRVLWERPSSVDRHVWSECAALGWFGLGLPETDGGVGYALAEEALVFREIGRHLAPGPFLASTLGARVAVMAGCSEEADAVIAGDAVVGFAQPRDASAVVGAAVSGEFDVIDGVDVSYLVVVAPTGAALLASDAAGPVEPQRCIDPAVRLGSLELDGVPAVAYCTADVDPTFDRGAVLAAAMLTGIAEATRDTAAEYAKARVQFGKPIGVHQAVKHRCADMAMRAEAAHSQVLFAALCIDDGRSDMTYQAAAAKVVAADAAIRNAASNIQIHGGIGYTFEHDAHLYVKRAHVLDTIVGDTRQHLARLIDLPAAQ